MLPMHCVRFVTFFLLTSSTAAQYVIDQRPLAKLVKGNQQANTQKHPGPSIIGGTDVPPGTFPYFGHYSSGGFVVGEFGGTLIHDDILIANADSGVPEGCTVLLDSITNGEGTEVTVEEILIHPDFEFFNLFSPNLMIMKLSEPVNIATIPWNTNSSIPADGDDVTTMGFGETGFGPPVVLQQVTIDAGPQEVCNEILEANGATSEQIDQFICTTTDGGGPCFNDYGSPLLTAADGTGDALGLVSFFSGSCFNGFGFYTDLASFDTWINEAICCLSDSPPGSCGDCNPDTLETAFPIDCTPENEDIGSAIALTVGQELVGYTANAPTTDLEECDVSGTLGLWYSVVGDGTALTVSACNYLTGYDTVISVTDEFGEFCTATNDDDPFCPFSLRSTVAWQTIPDITYYIFVHGFATEAGFFGLQITTPPTPLNDDCEGAIFNPSVVNGATVGATADDVTDCGSTSTSDYLGVWYTTVGTGQFMRATTCGGFTNYDTQLLLFTGECDDLTCIAGNDDDSSGQIISGCSTIEWLSDLGTLYTVYVYGVGDETGRFTLQTSDISPEPEVPENDMCEHAIELDEGEFFGSTSFATFDDVKSCGNNRESMNLGVWYEVEGDGETTWTVSTCSNSTNFDTQITIFEGECDDLKCVKGGDDDPSCDAGGADGIEALFTTTSFETEEDVKYYVYVHGFFDARGDFGLVVDSEDTPPLTPAEAWVVGTLTLIQMGAALIGCITGAVLFLC